MSRRSKRRRGPHRAGGEGAVPTGRTGEAGDAERGSRDGEGRQAAASAGASPQGRSASSWSLGLQLAFLVAVFAVVVLVAELAGAANLGVALGIGQIAFAIAVIYLLLRR